MNPDDAHRPDPNQPWPVGDSTPPPPPVPAHSELSADTAQQTPRPPDDAAVAAMWPGNEDALAANRGHYAPQVADAAPTLASDVIPAEPWSTVPTPIPTPMPARGSASTTPPRKLSTVVIVALVSGLLGGGIAAQVLKPEPSSLSPGTVLNNAGGDSSKRPADSIAGIAARVLPTVVSVETVSAEGSGNGSGQVIQSSTSFSYVLTNNHVILSVVESGGQIAVVLQNGEKYRATVVGRDPSYDLAVLRVAKGGLPVISMGDSSKVVVGDAVLAIGSPLGLTGTVTSGIISALRRPVTTNPSNASDETSFVSAIQTDAAINPGNSGGPLVDASGRMIGVNSAIATLGAQFSGQAGNIGVGFAVPINQARRVAQQIITTGKSTYPVIGVQLDRNYDGTGARIALVESGGPAERADLREGDIITRIDGQVMADTTSVITTVRSYTPGDRVDITIDRDGRTLTVTVTLGSRQSL